MRRSTLAITLLTGLVSLGSTVQAREYNLQSAFPKNLLIVGEAAEYFSQRLAAVTNGAIRFKHLGAGELSPPFEIIDNVGSGAIPAGWSYAPFVAGKAPAANLFGSIPFGPDAAKYMAWMYHGGGLELWRETYAKFNVVPFPCGAILSEAGGWLRKPISTPADLKGLKMRIGGLGGQILARAGGSPQNIPPGEIFTALQTGRLDGAELSNPAADLAVGLDKAARYYYFPGWHQPSGMTELHINKKVWDSFTEAQRIAIDMACRDTTFWAYSKASGEQQSALDELRKRGVNVLRFPEPVLQALRKAADELYAELSGKDAQFKKVLESYRAYSKVYDEYRALNRLD